MKDLFIIHYNGHGTLDENNGRKSGLWCCCDGNINPEDIIKIIKKYYNILTYQSRCAKFWIISDCCGAFG